MPDNTPASAVEAVIAKLDGLYWRDGHEVCADAIDLIRTLAGALEPFARRQTVEEVMASPPRDWLNASTERRIEMMGERKRNNDAAIAAARRALAGRE